MLGPACYLRIAAAHLKIVAGYPRIAVEYHTVGRSIGTVGRLGHTPLASGQTALDYIEVEVAAGNPPARKSCPAVESNRHTGGHKRHVVGLAFARTPAASEQGQAVRYDRPEARPAPMDLGSCPGPEGANRTASSASTGPMRAVCCIFRLLDLRT